MELGFSDIRLQRLFACLDTLREQFGDRCANAAVAHLASLRAASSLDEFRNLPGRCEELGQGGRLSLALPDGQHLIFEPETDTPRTTDEGLDWTAVRSVRIVAIADQ